MKKFLKIAVLGITLTAVTSCELDLLDNPNQLTQDKANVDYILNSVQLQFATIFLSATQFGMDNTRMLAMFGENYNNAYQAVSFDDLWTNTYSGMFPDVQALIERGEDQDLLRHTGIAKILKAYVLMTMVDYFGNIPYSEALDPENFNPVGDDDASVYAEVLNLLDGGIADLTNITAGTALVGSDLFGLEGDEEKWIVVAKTMKLKYYLQTRLVNAAESTAAINALIAEDLLIDDTDDFSEDFQFIFPANSFDNPNNYHPWFMDNYQNGASQYMSNFYMNEMYNGKPHRDPRMRYYFYRQTLSIPTDVNVLNCVAAPEPPQHYPSGMVYCFVGAGYFGRDHLDDAGIPPDTKLRTIYGLYPAGGKFDDGSGEPGAITDGAQGKGILPILSAVFTKFMLAEAANTLGTTGNTRTLMEEGVRASIDKVMNFNTAVVGPDNVIPTQTAIDNYVADVLSDYDNSSDKLDIVLKEYWLALFGNGVESYNMYRRTGKPTGMQPGLNANFGQFYRTFPYPSVYVNRNSSATQKADNTTQVFWDTNSPGFIE